MDLSQKVGPVENEKTLSLDRYLVSFSSHPWVGNKEQNGCWISSIAPIATTTSIAVSEKRPKLWKRIPRKCNLCILQPCAPERSLLSLIFNLKYHNKVCVFLDIHKCSCEIELAFTRVRDEHEMIRVVFVVHGVVLRKWDYLSSLSCHEWTRVKSSLGRKDRVVSWAKKSQHKNWVLSCSKGFVASHCHKNDDTWHVELRFSRGWWTNEQNYLQSLNYLLLKYCHCLLYENFIYIMGIRLAPFVVYNFKSR